MKIYDYETFEKYYKNIKAIKFKDFAKLSNWVYYSKSLFYWGKKFKAIYNREKKSGLINVIFYTDDKLRIPYDITFDEFGDVIEYIEVKDSLEIE